MRSDEPGRTEAVDLPGWAHYVSSVVADSESLAVRLVPETPLEEGITAFELRIDRCTDAAAADDVFRRAMQQDAHVYVFWREGVLVVDLDGDQVEVRALSFSGGPSEFTAEERVELKAASRDADSSAGILYRQQLEFIDRVFRAMEG